ncbi:hypothetical protein NKG94_38325 [Micromonospora sp. M12]
MLTAAHAAFGAGTPGARLDYLVLTDPELEPGRSPASPAGDRRLGRRHPVDRQRGRPPRPAP